MKALLSAAQDLDSRAKIIFVAECDFRNSDQETEFDFTYQRQCWWVIRHKLAHGRAVKLFIGKEIQHCVLNMQWLERSVIFTLKSERDEIDVVCSHFAHRDMWQGSAEEVLDALSTRKGRPLLVGDLNVESRDWVQNAQEATRRPWLLGALDSFGLQLREGTLDFTRRAKTDANDGKLDHKFLHYRLQGRVLSSCEGAPGDHCWLSWSIQFRTCWRSQLARRWHCNFAQFQADMDSNCPDSFRDWQQAQQWLVSRMESSTVRHSRRLRRLFWEPFAVKDLRRRIRIATDDHDRNDLSKQLFELRRRVAADRELIELRGDASFGKRIHKRPNNLFPVTEFVSGDVVSRSSDELAAAMTSEFERRWNDVDAEEESVALTEI